MIGSDVRDEEVDDADWLMSCCVKASGDWFSRRGCDDKLCGDVIAMTLCAPEADEEESWEEARLSLRTTSSL